MREQIIAWGGEVRFGARFEGMEFEDGRIVAVRGSQRQEEGTREKFVLPDKRCSSRAAIRRATG